MDKKVCAPKNFSQNYQSKSSHCSGRPELRVTDSYLVTMSRKLGGE